MRPHAEAKTSMAYNDPAVRLTHRAGRPDATCVSACSFDVSSEPSIPFGSARTGVTALRKYWTRYLDLLDNDLNTRIFDSFKNMVLCALLFAAGTNAVQTDHRVFLSLTAVNLAGWGIIAVSALLMLLNISDGIRRLGKLRYHLVFQVLIILIYLIVSERVVEIVWSFRA